MTTQFCGIIEADETYVGEKSRKAIRGRGSETKTPVVAIKELRGIEIDDEKKLKKLFLIKPARKQKSPARNTIEPVKCSKKK